MAAIDVVGSLFEGGAAAADIGSALLEGAQIVGGVLTVAGAVTGNKRLMQAGAIIGIGATAISAFSDLSGASATGSNRNYGTAPTKELQGYADDAAAASEAAGLANTSPDAMKDLFGAPADTSSALTGQSGYADALSPADNGVLFDAAQTPAAPTVAASGAITPPSYSPGAINGLDIEDGVKIKGSSVGQATQTLRNANRTLNSAPSTQGGATQRGLIDRTIDWLNNRENAGVIKLGTGLIGGAMQGYQQERALEEQRRARDEQRQYIEDQRTRYNRSILDQNLNAR